MSTFIDRILGKDKRSAKQAKDRLQLVLIHDRIDMNPGTMETLKDELIEVIRMPFRETVEAVKRGQIRDGKSVCALLRASRFVDEARHAP